MAVSIRLKMLGTKHRPCYRVVALDSRKTRDGKSLANLGQYQPLKQPAQIDINEEEILDYLNNGAVPSATVKNLLRQVGIVRQQKKSDSGKVRLIWTRRSE